MAGAPIGNKNGAKGGQWRHALQQALARAANSTVDRGLAKIADIVVAAALAGDREAWQEIGNRMDGRPAQALVNAGEDPLRIEIVAAASDRDL